MPELPEVETVVCDLRKSGVEGLSFKTARVFWHRTVSPHLPEVFIQKIKNRKIVRISRRAKFIVFQLEFDSWLLVHLRMTGRLDLFPADAAPDPYVRVSALLSDGRELRFKDIRKFGRWSFYEGEPPQFKTLGPEPLEKDFTAEVLTNCLAGHSRQIKPLLLDQTVVAGLGNIYVDEALWRARIHPLRSATRIKTAQARKMLQAIRHTLKLAISKQGTDIGDNVVEFGGYKPQVYQRDGAACRRCKHTIKRITVGQRGTHFCPKCQKR